MPNPAAFDNDVRSPYDAGLSYYRDEYSTGDGGNGDASRLGFIQLLAAAPGAIQEGENLLSAVGIGMTATDKTRQQRANDMANFANQGSVLAAQIIYAAPDNVSGNEAPYWQAAAKLVQAQRPDVWAEGMAAGKYWPVGADFNMTAVRAQIASDLSSVGVTVKNISQTIGSTIGNAPGSGATAAKTAGRSLISNPIVLIGAAGAAFFLLKRK